MKAVQKKITKLNSIVKGISIPDFERIFLEKNDSVYKTIFNLPFEEYPVQAYLLACTYYMLKKDNSARNDFRMMSAEIESIYGKPPKIKF